MSKVYLPRVLEFMDSSFKYNIHLYESMISITPFLIGFEYKNEKLHENIEREKQKLDETGQVIEERQADIDVKRGDQMLSQSIDVLREMNREGFYRLWCFQFEEEKGRDFGGLKREWTQTVFQEFLMNKSENSDLFNNDFGNHKLFLLSIYINETNPNFWKYEIFGKFLAKVIIDKEKVSQSFPKFFYKLLLNRQLCFTDLLEFDEDVYNSCRWLKENQVPDNIGMYFVHEIKTSNIPISYNLKENGDKIEVTEENKEELIKLKIHFLLIESIEKQVNKIQEGILKIIDPKYFFMFSHNELEKLICGIEEINSYINSSKFERKYNINRIRENK